jgi:hypothetical protein
MRAVSSALLRRGWRSCCCRAGLVDPRPVDGLGAGRPHPHAVRPEVHRLRLAGVDPAALAKLRRHEPAARPAVLTSRRATQGFRLLGVSWIPGAAPPIEVAVSTRDERGWSPWRDLGADEETTSPRGALQLWRAPLRPRARKAFLLVELRGFEPLTSAMRTQRRRLETTPPVPLATISAQASTLSEAWRYAVVRGGP